MMEVTEAIRTRRSVGRVTESVPQRAEIEQLLESARWAPNHHKTAPWRFIVLAGEGRRRLGDIYGKVKAEALDEAVDAKRQKTYDKGFQKALRAPVIIVVIVEPDQGEKVEWVEEVAATACAVQNMLLTAHSIGLATYWRTGEAAFHTMTKKAFGVSEKGLILGFLYVGFPEREPKAPPKKPYQEFTTWITE